MMAWALFCHDFDLSKGINILSEKCPVVLDHYTYPAFEAKKEEAAKKITDTLLKEIEVLVHKHLK